MDRLIFEPPWLYWENGEYSSQRWRARSGPYGQGSLPAGSYEGSNLRYRTNAAMTDREGFGWSLNLQPLFQTGRTLLRIHPDGNTPGSLGCIAVMNPNTIELHQSLELALWSQGGRVVVDVHYESNVS